MKTYEEKVMKSVQNSVISSFIWLVCSIVVCVVSFFFVDSTNTDIASFSTIMAFLSLLIAIGSVFYCKHYCVLFRYPKKIKIYNTCVLGYETDFDRGCYYLIVKDEKENKIRRVLMSKEDKEKYPEKTEVVVAKYHGVNLIEDIEKYTGDKFTRVDCK